MHEKNDDAKKTHEETHRSEPRKERDRDGEDAGVAPINPPSADGGKVRDDDKHPAGPVL